MRALLKLGRIDEAAAIVATTPLDCDPLKYWGDALIAQGDRKQALSKYDAALRLAPKWAELRHARSRIAS